MIGFINVVGATLHESTRSANQRADKMPKAAKTAAKATRKAS